MRSATRVVVSVLVCTAFLAANVAAQDALAELDAQGARVTRAVAGRRLADPGLSRVDAVRSFLRARHDETTLRDLVQTREHEYSGVVHVLLGQQVAGLDVYGTYVKASFSARGDLVSVIENLVSTGKGLRPARVGPEAALRAVLARNYPAVSSDLAEVSSLGNVITYERRPPFRESPTVTRVAIPLKGKSLDTGYLVVTWDRDNVLRHTIVSGRGEILREQLRTNAESYRVFPNHPGVTPQVLINAPADPVASPNGWLGASTTTIGNNVDAYLDRNNDDAADASGRPIAPNQVFDFVWDGSVEPTTVTNQMASVTNLFYLTNRLHDRLYTYGFTESAGNLQTDNFGRGGLGNDPLDAEAQDGGGVNNANIAVPPDGSRPRMQMYLWNTTTPGRDGALDSDIVYHEYGHSLTWRMIGDMDGVTGGAVGEGMSDALACYFNNDDRVAEYSYNNPIGIRSAPYTNYTRTYGLVVGFLGPHLDGEIYAATMWRLRQLWLGKGWSQDALMRYIVDGMNYTPVRPAYEDMRDGILTSIANLPTGIDSQQASCTVWDAFAQYGIGVGADGYEICVIGICLFKAVESFVKPAACAGPANTTPTVAISQPANNSSSNVGTPVTFTGSANDTEDGNLTASLAWTSNLQGQIGTGATFSRSDLIVGTHVVTASVTDNGGSTGSASVSITVNPNTVPTVAISQPANNSSSFAGKAVTFTGSANDAEDGSLTAGLVWTSSLQGQIGTGATFTRNNLVVGTHVVTASATDSGGLSGSASVTITVNPNTAPTVSISSPATNSKFTAGVPVTFTGSAADTQDGNITAGLVWSSSLQGQIGTGASFTRSALVVGTHVVTASVTDSGGLGGSAQVTVSVTNITLTATASKPKGKRQVNLAWSGASGPTVNIYRNNVLLVSTTTNDGAHLDTTFPKNVNTFVYRVCLAGFPTICSNNATATF